MIKIIFSPANVFPEVNHVKNKIKSIPRSHPPNGVPIVLIVTSSVIFLSTLRDNLSEFSKFSSDILSQLNQRS